MANFNINKVILGGRLTSDPELKTTPTGVSVASFSIAVNRRFNGKDEEQKADFINIVAWRQVGEFITRFFRKGSSICLVGSIQTRSWTDNNGNKRYTTEVVADEALFVDSKSEGTINAHKPENASQSATAAPAAPGYSYVPESYAAPRFEDVTEDDDLPY